jgi:hypothetical protein
MSESFFSNVGYRLKDGLLSAFSENTKNNILTLFNLVAYNRTVVMIIYGFIGVIVITFFLTGDSFYLLYLNNYVAFFEQLGLKSAKNDGANKIETNKDLKDI